MSVFPVDPCGPEAEGGVDGVFDLDEGVEEHCAAVVQVDVVSHVFGSVVGVSGVGSVDVHSF